MADKPRLFIKQESHITTFKIRGNPFAWVIIYNSEIANVGAVAAIRRKANNATKWNCPAAARKYNQIADILAGVAA